MSDMRGSAVICDDRCGCPSPCPGGIGCQCVSGGSAGQDVTAGHKQCSCGEHCGCNPCSCSKSENVRGTGKAFCKCGSGCACPTCAA